MGFSQPGLNHCEPKMHLTGLTERQTHVSWPGAQTHTPTPGLSFHPSLNHWANTHLGCFSFPGV